MRKAIYVFALTFFFAYGWEVQAQSRPAFCESISDGLLGGLAEPYARQIAPDGSAYCEGLIRTPIALLPPSVISIKQNQPNDPVFRRSETASLTWCSDSQDLLHLKLRSTTAPLFALDAMHANKFEWKADEIAIWQPNWKNLAALASRNIPVKGQKSLVFIPLRIGKGYSSDYSFILHSKESLHLTKALLEPVDPSGKPSLVDISFASGPSKETWTTVISFKNMNKGVYQITFEEGVDGAGVTADPIYLFHKACASQ